MYIIYGAIAQFVEQLAYNRQVPGAWPGGTSTNFQNVRLFQEQIGDYKQLLDKMAILEYIL